MTIIEKLDTEVNMFLTMSDRDITLIAINTKDWDEFSIAYLGGDGFTKKHLKLKYGSRVKIIRTDDIEQGNFIIK